MIRRAIVNHLKAAPGVTAVLGGRIYPLEIPQNLETSPAASVALSSATRSHSKEGPMGLVQAEIFVVCWSRRVLEAEDAANAVRKELDGFRGPLEGLTIRNIRSGTERDMDEYIDIVGAYGIAVDYTIDYEEV